MKTIEDAVRELDGDWNTAENSSPPKLTCSWYVVTSSTKEQFALAA